MCLIWTTTILTANQSLSQRLTPVLVDQSLSEIIYVIYLTPKQGDKATQIQWVTKGERNKENIKTRKDNKETRKRDISIEV